MKKKVLISILVILLLVIGSIAYLFGIGMIRTDAKPEPGDIKVAAVGDSITYGLFVANWPKNQYPHQLDDLLGPGYAVKNFGVSNHTAQLTGDYPLITTKYFKESIDFSPDIVIIMLGTNDAKKMNWLDADTFKRQYQAVVNLYQILPEKPRIILASPATVFKEETKTVAVEKANLLQIKEIVAEVAQDQGLEYVDIHALTADKRELFTKDGLHPNAAGARFLAEAFAKVVKQQSDKL